MISTEVVNLTAEQQASTVLWKCTQSFCNRVMYSFVFGEFVSLISYSSRVQCVYIILNGIGYIFRDSYRFSSGKCLKNKQKSVSAISVLVKKLSFIQNPCDSDFLCWFCISETHTLCYTNGLNNTCTTSIRNIC